VQGLHTVAEYRPDYAFGTRHVLADAPRCRAMPQVSDLPALHADARRAERLLLRRPLWLLEEPEPLACRDGRPCRGGPLALENGPERIETGWWDERGIARDYYVAKAPDGAWLWVFRDRRDGGRGGWYLHGLFG